jgi:O-antigen ligase
MTAIRLPRPGSGRLQPDATAVKVGLGVVALVAACLLALLGTSLLAVIGITALLIVVIALALALTHPEALIPIAIYSMWFEGVAYGPLSVGRAVAALIPVIIVLRIVTTPWRPPALQLRAWVPVALLTIWAWAGAFYSKSFAGGWLLGFFTLFLGVIYFVAFALFTESPDQLCRLFMGWVWVGSFASILSDIAHFGFGYRTSGFTGNPNIFAVYLVAGLPIIAVLLRHHATTHRQRWMLYLSLPIFLSALVASGSRMGLIMGAVVGVYIFVTLPGLSLQRRIVSMVGGAFVMAATVVMFIVLNPERFSPAAFVSDRGAGRVDLWTAGVKMLGDSPIVGRGLGGFRLDVFDVLQQTTNADLNVLRQPEFIKAGAVESHNLYLTVAIDLGIIGFILYFGVIAVAFVNLWQKRRSEWSELVWAFIGILGAILVASFFGSQTNSKLQWLIVGVSAGLWVRQRVSPPRSPVSIGGPPP